MRSPALKRFNEALKVANSTGVGGPEWAATVPPPTSGIASSTTSNTEYLRRMLSPSLARGSPLRRRTPSSSHPA